MLQLGHLCQIGECLGLPRGFTADSSFLLMQTVGGNRPAQASRQVGSCPLSPACDLHTTQGRLLLPQLEATVRVWLVNREELQMLLSLCLILTKKKSSNDVSNTKKVSGNE